MTHLEIILTLGAIGIIGVGYTIYRYVRHQYVLRDRAHLMREAIRNKDFTFRLPTKGLSFGERALQEALNDFGLYINTLSAQKEVESWQRLTRVLTHEIMNAATPICSITQAYLTDPKLKDTPYDEGIRAIHTTCIGMTEFVKNFRKMSALQEPYITDFPLLDLLLSLKAMHTDITWHLNIESETRIKADENMLRQVLTNLIQNAKEAGAKDIDIRFTKTIRESNNAYDNEHKFSLYVSNNGTPIRAEVRSEIFIPFFTTKPTGNGIGLPLSRQMMMKQGINLVLCEHAMPGYHTTFALCN